MPTNTLLEMCRVLQIPNSTYYYERKAKNEYELTVNIIDIFMDFHNNYGTQKIILHMSEPA